MTAATKIRPRLVLPVDADEDVWLGERRHGVTATDIAKITGVHRYGSAYEVFLDKTDPPAKSDPGEAARWGHRLEPVIAQAWAEENEKLGRIAPAGFYAHGEHDWMRATPDRLVLSWVMDREVDPLGLLEVKSALGWSALDWDDDRAPDAHQFQVQWQLAVTGLDRAWLVALAGPRLVTHLIERDDQLIADLMAIGHQFWTEHVLKGIPPTPDGSERLVDLLGKRWQPDPDKTVVLNPDEFAPLKAAFDLASADEKAAKFRKQEAANAIRLLLTDAEAGVIDGQTVATWRTVERKGFTVEPTSYRKLDFPRGSR